MQNNHQETEYFRKSLELILGDVRGDFYSQIHDIVLQFGYGEEDGNVAHRDDQAKKLAENCVENMTHIIGRRFNMIADEWPHVFAAYTKISDKVPNLVKEGFIVLAAWRRVGCSEIITEQVRDAHKVGKYFLGNFGFYQDRLANEALESRLHSSIMPITHELLTLILGKDEKMGPIKSVSEER